jgi:hypothetical protein
MRWKIDYQYVYGKCKGYLVVEGDDVPQAYEAGLAAMKAKHSTDPCFDGFITGVQMIVEVTR